MLLWLVKIHTYFNDSIINNFKISKYNEILLEIRKACKEASIDSYIMLLEHQYDEEVVY